MLSQIIFLNDILKAGLKKILISCTLSYRASTESKFFSAITIMMLRNK